jgi:Fic family protein
MPRALFLMLLITEVHPFEDGNGRVARLMMNAELSAIDQFKCMIPTVHRDNYLNGLRGVSRNA